MYRGQLSFLIPRMMKHAFLSGVVAARSIPGHEEVSGPKLWTEYEPYPLDLEKWEAFLATVPEKKET